MRVAHTSSTGEVIIKQKESYYGYAGDVHWCDVYTSGRWPGRLQEIRLAYAEERTTAMTLDKGVWPSLCF